MADGILNNHRIMGFVASAKHEEARDFYSTVLGLKLIHDDDFAMVFEVFDRQVLRVQKLETHTPQPFTSFGWQVSEIVGICKTLAERGVKFMHYGFPGQDDDGICTFPNADKVAWFNDPDGNILSLAEIAG